MNHWLPGGELIVNDRVFHYKILAPEVSNPFDLMFLDAPGHVVTDEDVTLILKLAVIDDNLTAAFI